MAQIYSGLVKNNFFTDHDYGLFEKSTSRIVIVITFCSPSCLGQESVKEFDLRVKLPPAQRCTTNGGGCPFSH